MEVIMAEAKITDVKAFFEYTDSRVFMDDWKQLSDADKAWFKSEVGKLIEKVS
jgi:hypothetical protein